MLHLRSSKNQSHGACGIPLDEPYTAGFSDTSCPDCLSVMVKLHAAWKAGKAGEGIFGSISKVIERLEDERLLDESSRTEEKP